MFLFFYIYSIIILIIPIIKIIIEDLLDNSSIYLCIGNYILLFSLLVLNRYIYLVLISGTLLVFSYLLIRDMKNKLGNYQVLSIPYFILCIYMFSYILINLNY